MTIECQASVEIEIENILSVFPAPPDKDGKGVFSSSYQTALQVSLKKDASYDYEDFLSQVEKKRNRLISGSSSKTAFVIFNTILTLTRLARSTNDIRSLNTALKMVAKIRKKIWTWQLYSELKILEKLLIESAHAIIHGNDHSVREFTERLIENPIESLAGLDASGSGDSGVVVFSPSFRSSYTLAVLELLKRHNIQIRAVVTRRLFSTKRVKIEAKRDGMRLVRKVIRKLIRLDDVRMNPAGRNLSDVRRDLNLRHATTEVWCRENRVSIVYCETLGEKRVVDRLSLLNYDFGIFTGGGLLPSSLLKTANRAILNCHAGILPHYRGMDVIEWPVLFNDQANIGLTVHLMSDEVDEGRIVIAHRLEKSMDILSARWTLESLAPYMIVLGLLSLINSKVEPAEQKKTDGKNHYVLHPALFEIARELSSGSKT
jgi:methionyl-tRNA formyltransferase